MSREIILYATRRQISYFQIVTADVQIIYNILYDVCLLSVELTADSFYPS